jgi:hypothetical protein
MLWLVVNVSVWFCLWCAAHVVYELSFVVFLPPPATLIITFIEYKQFMREVWGLWIGRAVFHGPLQTYY